MNNIIKMEFNKSRKTNINQKAQKLLTPTGYALHQAFSSKINSTDDIQFTFSFVDFEDLARKVNFSVEKLKEGLGNLFNTGYIIQCDDCLKFYQNGTTSAKDDFSTQKDMMNDNYYVVREWVNRYVW